MSHSSQLPNKPANYIEDCRIYGFLFNFGVWVWVEIWIYIWIWIQVQQGNYDSEMFAVLEPSLNHIFLKVLCVFFLDEKTFDDWKDMKNDSECGIKRTSLEFQPGVMVTWWLQMYCKICIFFSLLFLCDMYKIQFIFYIPTRKLLFLFRQLTSWCPLHCE